MAKVGIKQFWSDRFGDNAHHGDWLSEFASDISATAADVEIDWFKSNIQAIRPGVKLANNQIAVTERKKRHFLELNWREARNGIKYPIIQFTTHANGGSSVFWNGYEALAELFEREGGRLLNDVERDRLQAARLKKEDARRQQAEKNARADRRLAKHTALRRKIYHTRYMHGITDAAKISKHPYAMRKGITADVISACGELAPRLVAGKEFFKGGGTKWRKNWRGWLALPMIDFSGRYCGQSRIYADGSKAHARGSDMSQAHIVIGDIKAADQLDYVEGFATGSSVYKAHRMAGRDNVAVVVCFDKNGLSRVVKHYGYLFDSKRHIIRADNDHFKFLEGKGNSGVIAALELAGMMSAKKIKATAPSFEALSITGQPTDYNDLEALGGLRIVMAQLTARNLRLIPEKNMFLNKLQMLRLTGRNGFLKAAKRAASAGAALVPHEYDRATIAREIMASIPPQAMATQKELNTIKSFLSWCVKQRFEMAAATKNFSAEALTGDNVQHIKINAEITDEGYAVIPASVFDMVRSLKGSVILKAKHGTGKTERVMGPLMRDTSGGAGMIVHRVSLANQMSNELDLKHYKELDSVNVNWNTRMVTCVNSVIRQEFDWYWQQAELLCIDEATQVLRHVMGGVDAIHAPVKAYNKLIHAARCAEKVLLADADANDSLITFLNQARPGQPIHVIEIESPAPDLTVNYCANVAFVYQQILDAARKKSKRILVATDSIKKAHMVAEGVKSAWPEARVLCITAETKGQDDAIKFSDDPNRVAADIDVLIYSPVISSGVSIRAAAASFDCHFGLFHGVVVPSDIMQMIRRDRGAKSFLVGFLPNHDTHQTDRDALLRGLLSAYEQSRQKLDWQATDGGVMIRTTQFDDMYLDVVTAQARSRSEYISHSLMLMAADGWKINAVSVDDLTAEIGAEQMNNDREVVKHSRHARIHAATTPTEAEYKTLKRAELLTPENIAQIARYEIENRLGVPVTDDAIEFIDDRGMIRVRRLETLRGTQEQINKVENWENEKGVVLTQRRLVLARWQILNRVFDILGLDRLTGQGDYSVMQARDVVAMLTGSQAAIDEYNALRIGPQINAAPTCATRFVKGLLERFVPVVNAKKLNGVQFYRLQSEKWAELNHYCAARAAIGEHALNQDSTADLHDDSVDISQLCAITNLPTNDQLAAIYGQPEAEKASNHADYSEGGEILEHNIKHNSKISPPQKDLLLSVIQWLKNPMKSTQFTPAERPIDRLDRLGVLTLPNLMRLARGWLDPECRDARFGKVSPANLMTFGVA